MRARAEMNERERVGLTSGQLYNWLQDHPDKKSKASVILFMNDMVDEGILDYEEKSGKGGYHRVYYPKMNRKHFAEYIIDTITRKLKDEFS